eukprot:SAG31_NODE_39391_length_288_cov_1.354497_1_plen_75_part_10
MHYGLRLVRPAVDLRLASRSADDGAPAGAVARLLARHTLLLASVRGRRARQRAGGELGISVRARTARWQALLRRR